MRAIILCIFALFLVTASKAQSATASLNITLTDVQSVTFSSIISDEIATSDKYNSQTGNLQILSQSTSQIKKIGSKTSEHERLYKEFYSDKNAVVTSLSRTNTLSAGVSNSLPKSKISNPANLVIYQIDPR